MNTTIKNAPLPEIARHLGLRKGKNKNWHCPNSAGHNNNDQNASLSIMENGYNCYACGIKGGILDLIQLILNVDRRAATQWIKNEFGNNSKPSINNTSSTSGTNEKSQIRLISENPKNRFLHIELDSRLTGDPAQEDINNISRDLRKQISLKTLKKVGIKIYSNPYSIIYPPRLKRCYNPHKIKDHIYFEGCTDWLTAIELELDKYYSLHSIYNRTTKVTIKNLGEHIFILDSDVTPENMRSRLVIKSKKGIFVKIIQPPDRHKDFSDWFNIGNCTQKDVLDLIDQTPAETIEPIDETESFTPDESQNLPADEDSQRSYNLTDMGNAERLENQFHNDAKYDHECDAWFIWNGQRWEKDETGNIYRFAKVVVRSIYGEASEVEDDKGRKRIVTHGLKSENIRAIDAMINLGKNEERLAVKSEYFNQDPLLFNLLNGVYDFDNMEFREHRKSDRITMISKYNYDKDAEHEKWDEFLNLVFDNNREIIDFLQLVIGYSLTGKVDVDKLFFFYGSGDNGKTTFFEPIKVLFGDYFQRIASETLMYVKTQSRDPANSNITDLMNKRFVLISEVRSNMPLDENMLKQLVGGDEIRARAQYQTGFNFKPTHKLWMYGNDKPKIRVTDPGTWRRICLIPFTVQIPPDMKRERSEVISELLKELSGIFNWAIIGYEKYLEKGLVVPPYICKASNIYQTESDLVQQFIRCCTEEGEKVTLKNLYLAYEHFMKKNQEKNPLGIRKVKEKLIEKEYIFFNGTNNTVFCKGIALIEEYENEVKERS